MRRHHSERSRVPSIVGAVLGVLLLLGGVAYALKSDPPPARAGQVVGYSTPPPAPIPVTHLRLPARPRLLILGDSWVYGYGATPHRKAFAYLLADRLSWPHTILGAPGTGYAVDAAQQPRSSYQARVAALPEHPAGGDPNVAIIQGSTNDNHAPPAAVYRAEVATVRKLKVKYPGVAVILLGPVYDPKDYLHSGTPPQVGQLYEAAAATGAAFINPVSEQWFTEATWRRYVSGNNGHPNNLGYSYLTDRIIHDMKILFGRLH